MDNFKLNHWIIDVKACRLKKPEMSDDEAVVIHQRTMDVLIYLCLRPNEVISDEQLIDEVWYGIQEGHDCVKYVIRSLIKALEDNDQPAQFIEVIPDIGYRMLAAPHGILQAQSKQGSINAYTLQTAQHSKSHHIFNTAGLLALVAFIIIITTLATIGLSHTNQVNTAQSRQLQQARAQQQLRLVVLPFSNKSDDGDDDYLGDGIAESFIDALSVLPSVDVLAPQSAFAFKHKQLKAYEIGSHLRASHVLKGEVKKQNGRFHLSLTLLSVKNFSQIWSNKYQFNYTDLLSMQSTLVNDVVKQLPLPNDSAAPSDHSPISQPIKQFGEQNIKAYEKYLFGRYHLQQNSANALVKALRAFEQATLIDPTFALAYTGIADSRLKQWQLGYAKSADAAKKSEWAINQALQLSPDLATAHTSKGILLARQNQSALAHQALDKAISLKPSEAQAYLVKAILYQRALAFHQAFEALGTAIKLNPKHLSVNYYAGVNKLLMGELDEGIKYLINAIDRNNQSPRIELSLSHWYKNYGFIDKANQWAEVAYTKNAQQFDSHIAMAYSADDKDEIELWLQRAKSLKHTTNQAFISAAQLFDFHGEAAALQALVQQHLYTAKGQLKADIPTAWLKWAAMVKMSQQQYQQASELLQMSLKEQSMLSTKTSQQIKLVNLLAYCYKKQGKTDKMNATLAQSKTIQSYLVNKGLKTPYFVIQMVAYYALKDQQHKAEQLLRNATAKGWRLENYVANNPILELLDNRQHYMSTQSSM